MTSPGVSPPPAREGPTTAEIAAAATAAAAAITAAQNAAAAALLHEQGLAQALSVGQKVEEKLAWLRSTSDTISPAHLSALLNELFSMDKQLVASQLHEVTTQFQTATCSMRDDMLSRLARSATLYHEPAAELHALPATGGSGSVEADGGMSSPKSHRPDQQAALTEALALAQSVEQGMLMLRCLPGSPQGSHWTFLLIELVRAEEQLVDYGFPELVGQFLAETAGLRSWLARHIRNHPAMAPGGGSVDLFQMPLPTVVLYRGGSSSSQGEDSTNPGRGRLGDDERARRMDQNLCLACGKSGHWKDDCPNMSKGKKGKKGPSRSR
jgi:hypothetical protein